MPATLVVITVLACALAASIYRLVGGRKSLGLPVMACLSLLLLAGTLIERQDRDRHARHAQPPEAFVPS